jgi:hypothetical protein
MAARYSACSQLMTVGDVQFSQYYTLHRIKSSFGDKDLICVRSDIVFPHWVSDLCGNAGIFAAIKKFCQLLSNYKRLYL